ncbi:uroporphyrinogen-III C-methyltransferase [Xylanimonas ulmi]|uniref:uroporphyrinogen-III C-methyltransferase n=1 Tax=Xylanimonas ulmi TaxID=228973 RepID=A0A4Q7M5H6_9MICO|nr:uroporphyrin-III C-methyltransferase [Xylanibacterium ulmi]
MSAGAPTGAGPVEARAPRRGRVWLVGGGPGDPDLITVKGLRLLRGADVIVVDRLAPRALLDDLPRVLAGQTLVVDVGKHPGHHPVRQSQIDALIVEHALAGRDVVRLKGGDPYVLGRGGEEVAACVAAGVPVEVVPGVTSAVAVPSAAGIPLTHRGVARGFTVLSGHDDVSALLGGTPGGPGHTLVLLMAVAGLAHTAWALVAGGRPIDTPAAIVEDGFGPRQRTTLATLGTLAQAAAEAGVRNPAVVVVGDVVTLAPDWVGEVAGGQRMWRAAAQRVSS